MKKPRQTAVITWKIVRRCSPYNPNWKRWYLCLNEIMKIATYRGNNLLNKKTELISKCRQQNKYNIYIHIYIYIYTYMYIYIYIHISMKMCLKMCVWYYILLLYICSKLIMEGRLYMYRVLTATGHGRELQAPPLVFGAKILFKCKKIVYKCK